MQLIFKNLTWKQINVRHFGPLLVTVWMCDSKSNPLYWQHAASFFFFFLSFLFFFFSIRMYQSTPDCIPLHGSAMSFSLDQVVPMYVVRSSCDQRFCLALVLLPFLGCHSVTLPVCLLSSISYRCPDHLQLASLIFDIFNLSLFPGFWVPNFVSYCDVKGKLYPKPKLSMFCA